MSNDLRRAKLWAGLLAAALAIGCDSDKFALHIIGNQDLVGATVVINGQRVGRVDELLGTGGHFATWLPHGTYSVEIQKEGFVAWNETVTVVPSESEYYIDAKLQRNIPPETETQGPARSPYRP